MSVVERMGRAMGAVVKPCKAPQNGVLYLQEWPVLFWEAGSSVVNVDLES